jgi:hypothetical protein
VDQELLLRHEYLVAENRMTQLRGRVRLPDAEGYDSNPDGLDVAEHLAGATILRGDHLGREVDRGRPSVRGDDLLETRERAAPRLPDIYLFYALASVSETICWRARVSVRVSRGRSFTGFKLNRRL